MLATWDPYLADLMAKRGELDQEVGPRRERFLDRSTSVRGIDCRVIELTGEPGDAVFCNLGLLHAVTPNHGDWPRFQRTKFLFLDDRAHVG